MCKECESIRKDKKLLKEKLIQLLYENERKFLFTEEIISKYRLRKSDIRDIFREVYEENKKDFLFIDVSKFIALNEYALAKREYSLPDENVFALLKFFFRKKGYNDEVPKSLRHFVKSTNKREAIEEAYSKKISYMINKIKLEERLRSLEKEENELIKQLKNEKSSSKAQKNIARKIKKTSSRN